MFPYHLFVRRDVHAINLVTGYIAVDPLNFGSRIRRTEHDFSETAWSCCWVIPAAPGMSRSIRNLGISTPP